MGILSSLGIVKNTPTTPPPVGEVRPPHPAALAATPPPRAPRRNKARELTPEQAAAREARKGLHAEWIKSAAAAVKTGQKPPFFAASCERRPYSDFNTFMIALSWVYGRKAQGAPQPSILGGFQQWRKHGRKVRKGAKGYFISVPFTPSAGKNLGAQLGEDLGAELGGGGLRPRFTGAYVFDVSDTEEMTAEDLAREKAYAVDGRTGTFHAHDPDFTPPPARVITGAETPRPAPSIEDVLAAVESDGSITLPDGLVLTGDALLAYAENLAA